MHTCGCFVQQGFGPAEAGQEQQKHKQLDLSWVTDMNTLIAAWFFWLLMSICVWHLPSGRYRKVVHASLTHAVDEPPPTDTIELMMLMFWRERSVRAMKGLMAVAVLVVAGL